MKKIESQGDQATIVLVHGAFEHGGRYKELVEQFQRDGFTVIYGDLPGQGSSDGKKGHIQSFDDYITTIEAWIKKADPNKKVFLMGHSMGGLAVIRTLEEIDIKVDGVILSSPALGIINKASKPLEFTSYFLNLFFPSWRVKAPQDPKMITRNQCKIDEFHNDPWIIEKVSIRWYREFQKGIIQAFSKVGSFPDVPLLVMQAEEDYMVEVEKTIEWFHNVKNKEKSYKQWPGLYHEIFNEPEWRDVYRYALSFLKQHINEYKEGAE